VCPPLSNELLTTVLKCGRSTEKDSTNPAHISADIDFWTYVRWDFLVPLSELYIRESLGPIFNTLCINLFPHKPVALRTKLHGRKITFHVSCMRIRDSDWLPNG
jgi:hypothetical protein